jgi:NTE family protein
MPGTNDAPITEADGVFQGGGVKGLALVGGLLEFAKGEVETKGGGRVKIDKWENVAGTSAGAIIAAFLALDWSAEQLDGLMREMPYAEFEDWGRGGKWLGGGLNLLHDHGLAHGRAFHDWLEKELKGATFADPRLKRPPSGGPAKVDDPYRLRMIAADVTNREMLVLPADLAKYRHVGEREAIDPEQVTVADAVRMSMSIPYFFQPISLEHIKEENVATIVDGGVLSNFPVWLFDAVGRAPKRPTFGFHLTGGRGLGGAFEHIVERMGGWPVRLGTDIFHTATEAWDKRFMANSTAVRTCSIDAGDIATTQFDLDAKQQDGLVEGGERDARKFLAEFDFAKYMNTFGQSLADRSS